MKLLAVVAIGVIALIGAPTTGAAKSLLLTKSCGAFLKNAEATWRTAESIQERAQEVGDKLGKAAQSGRSNDFDKFSEEWGRLARENNELLEIIANYAQIYAAFCK